MNLLLTGFEPFLGEKENPSQMLVRALNAELGIPFLELPVSYRRSFQPLEQALKKDPSIDFVLMLGQAGGRRKIGLERMAVNFEHAEAADEEGDRAQERPLVPGGPLALQSPLPLVAWKDALVAQGHAVEVSHHAGTFVCNAVNYRGLLLAQSTRTKFLFVHVPHLPSQRSERFNNHDGIPFAAQLAAIKDLLALIVSQYQA